MDAILDWWLALISQPDGIGELVRYFRGGGFVMYPLLMVSTLMWTLIIERMITFHRLEFRDMRMDELLLWQRKREPVTWRSGLRQQICFFMQQNRSNNRYLNRRLLDQCYLEFYPSIDRHITVITVLATISPLLGLLGTVTGMITTFDVIALFGTGTSRAMAGGISEALITTQSGLLVSIPGIFASAVLVLRARRLRGRLEESVITLKRIV
ncbi:MAG: MotA/TolQ/ExbB proton channel family protein [Deltaproteobacteria bacterium]|nr:MotA/TolQ/ExbB proton channel family protein [Deltaproteobacteria bacterium]